MDRCFLLLSKRIIGELTQLGEIAGKELFYKSKLSLTPKRKVASYVGRLCEEGKFLLMNTFMHCRMIMREKEIFYKSKLSLTPKRKVASYSGRLCEEGKVSLKCKLSSRMEFFIDDYFYALPDDYVEKKCFINRS